MSILCCLDILQLYENLLGDVPKVCRDEWQTFGEEVRAAERAAAVAEGGFAFAFVEGILVQALKSGSWLLLDEINLAPAEVHPAPLSQEMLLP